MKNPRLQRGFFVAPKGIKPLSQATGNLHSIH